MELYSSTDGAVNLEVRFDGETAWATQAQMAELFGADPGTIGLHLRNAFDEQELDREGTTEDFSVVRREGSRDVARSIQHYNLDAIISVGYRGHSARCALPPVGDGDPSQRILDQNAQQLRRARQLTDPLCLS